MPRKGSTSVKSCGGLVLYGYWRSGTSYRARIALNLKGIGYETIAVNLLAGEQCSEAFLKINPQGLVPVLVTPTSVLTQSTAIMEWLEETFPDPPLLPKTTNDRAIVRAMSLTVACDIHPLNNVRILDYLVNELGADRSATSAWAAKWICAGLEPIEKLIGRHGGKFAFGDNPTIADCHLIPQIYSAERFGVELAAFPNVMEVVQRARSIPAFMAAAPELQPDAPTVS